MSDKGSGDDGGKTVIRPMPGASPAQPNPMPGATPNPMPGSGAIQQPPGAAGPAPGAPPQSPPSGGRTAQATVIGGQLPPQSAWGTPGSPGTPQGGNQGFGGEVDSGAADAWMSGPSTPAPQGNPPGFWGDNSTIGTAAGASDGFFPTAAPQQQVRQQPMHKIDLHSALQSVELGHGAGSNPITAAAASLLILFGRLRTEMVDMEAKPLMEHVTREIEAFERRASDMGVDPHEIQVAKYCLCGTADDIVQNIPGTDHHLWLQYSMVARFFNRRTSGVGFFQEVEKALQAPAQRFQILELMLTCLSLGFEGQYRSQQNGPAELGRIRTTIYESLRRVVPRPDEDVSPHWKPVEMGRRRRFGGTPVWLIASIVGAVLFGVYMGLRVLLSADSAEVADTLRRIHPDEMPTIRAASFTAYEPPAILQDTTQFDRINTALSGEISDGTLSLDQEGDFIAIRVSNLVLFPRGGVEVKAEFDAVAQAIAEALNTEPGEILVVGHTDSDPMSGRGRFKNNQELSVARAQGVATMMAQYVSQPERVIVEGRGENEPIASNDTSEGKAQNRRVEIMIQREETL